MAESYPYLTGGEYWVARILSIIIFGLLLWAGAILWGFLSSLAKKSGKKAESRSKAADIAEVRNEETLGEVVGKGLSQLFKRIVRKFREIPLPKKASMTGVLKSLAALVILLSSLVLVWVIILNLLGYKFDKSYVGYSQKSCLENLSESQLEGCVFWSRNNYLEKQESWESHFERDDKYCENLKGKNRESCKFKYIDLCEGEPYDPRCSYEAFKDQKRQESWSYLVSDEKDEFYYSCLDSLCPKWSLFKLFK